MIYESHLSHHGIKGQQWGVQNGPPYPLNESKDYNTSEKISKLLEKGDTTYNLDKFGKDGKHNALYITGLSGSGKSSLSRKIAKLTNSELIELDNYIMRTEKDKSDFFANKNRNFDKFLKKEVPEFNYSLKGRDRLVAFDQVVKATKKYAEQLHPSKGLIVEGLQLSDPELFGRQSFRNEFFKDTPIIFKNTSPIKSEIRAIKRTISHKYYKEAVKMVKDVLVQKGDTRLSDAKRIAKDIDELEKLVNKYSK